MNDNSIMLECYNELLNSANENCREVEGLALETICSQHMPLLNSTLCLTELDCKVILEKYHLHCESMTEHLIVLIALTDFISCVCSNSETFPLSSRKNGFAKAGIKFILHKLKTAWLNILRSVNSNVSGITANQLINAMKITERCIERVPQNYKIFLEIILKMQDKTLYKVQNSSTVSHRPSLKPKQAAPPLEHVEVVPMEVTDSKDSTSINAPLVTKSAPKLKESKKENEGKKKKSYDITKFVLKPCENVVKDEPLELPEGTVPQKGKFEEIEEACKSEKRLLVEDKGEHQGPLPKKHCVRDDLINGKVNAFKMLMKSHKRLKPKITVQCK